MTKIDENLILKLEKLARLKLTDDERSEIKGDLNKIVEMFDKLQEVDTEGVEPTRHMTDHPHPVREDEVHGQLSREDALANAPESKDGHIAVPKFLKPKSWVES